MYILAHIYIHLRCPGFLGFWEEMLIKAASCVSDCGRVRRWVYACVCLTLIMRLSCLLFLALPTPPPATPPAPLPSCVGGNAVVFALQIADGQSPQD